MRTRHVLITCFLSIGPICLANTIELTGVGAATATASSEAAGLVQTQQETAKNTASSANVLDELKQRTRQLEAQIEAQLTERNQQVATTVNSEQPVEGMRYREVRDQQHVVTEQSTTASSVNEQGMAPTAQTQPSDQNRDSTETSTLANHNQSAATNDVAQPNTTEAPAGTAYQNTTESPQAAIPTATQHTPSATTTTVANPSTTQQKADVVASTKHDKASLPASTHQGTNKQLVATSPWEQFLVSTIGMVHSLQTNIQSSFSIIFSRQGIPLLIIFFGSMLLSVVIWFAYSSFKLEQAKRIESLINNKTNQPANDKPSPLSMAYAEESSGDYDVFSTSEGVPIKLDLAQAYINMQDIDGAKTVLNDIIAQHRGKIVTAAQEMLKKISQ
jgi:FimV-like protein